MTYSKDKYQLTQLLQDAWIRLGQLNRWTVTGGSTTTSVDTAWAGVEEPVFEDNDPALIYGTVVVLEDAGGLGAAPEGEMARITAYDSSTSTITHDAVSSTISSGDKIGIASPLFPLEDMMELANIAIQRLGTIDVVDTSLSSVGGTTQYTLPATIRQRPVQVRLYPTGLNQKPRIVQGWSVVPALPGSNWTLNTPFLENGFTMEITYRGIHPKLKSYDAFIQESIHPELALCATVVEALRWYNNRVGGSNQFFLQRESQATQDLEYVLAKYPILGTVEQIQGLPHWNTNNSYVPGTSDLRA